MGKTIPKIIQNGCPNPTCGADIREIWWQDNHGMRDLLETHCNRCGWKKDRGGIVTCEGKPQTVNLKNWGEQKG